MRRGVDRQPRLSRLPCHARRRARRAPLAVACSTVPLQPRQRRPQNQQAAHQAAQCCTGKQRRPWRCGAAALSCPRSRHTAARPSTSCRRCAPSSEAPDAPSPPAALRSAAHGPRHAELTLSLPNRLPAEGLAGAHSLPRRPCPPRRASEQRKSGGGCHALRNGSPLLSLFAFSLQPSCHLAVVPLSSFSLLSLHPLSRRSRLPHPATPPPPAAPLLSRLLPPFGATLPSSRHILAPLELSSRKDDSSDAHCDHLPPSHVVAQVHSLSSNTCASTDDVGAGVPSGVS